jgi:hypothetical protein
MSQEYSYRKFTLSLWQSAVAQVQRNRNSVQSRVAPSTTVKPAVSTPPVVTDLMSPVYVLGPALAAGQPVSLDALGPSQATAVAAPAVVQSFGTSKYRNSFEH